VILNNVLPDDKGILQMTIPNFSQLPRWRLWSSPWSENPQIQLTYATSTTSNEKKTQLCRATTRLFCKTKHTSHPSPTHLNRVPFSSTPLQHIVLMLCAIMHTILPNKCFKRFTWGTNKQKEQKKNTWMSSTQKWSNYSPVLCLTCSSCGMCVGWFFLKFYFRFQLILKR
jgi:hypothetical protein